MRLRGTNRNFRRVSPRVPFNPMKLFRNSEQGVHYDPSDFSTLFQDSAGTTPVTAVEQPVGLMLDKRLGLVLGNELIVNGDGTTTAGWNASGATLSSSNGKLVVTANTTGVAARATQAVATVAGRAYQVTFRARKPSGVGVSVGSFASGTSAGSSYGNSATETDRRYVFFAVGSSTLVNFEMPASGITAGDLAEFDNISVRELSGNHAFQTTAIDRPILRNRYNLLTKTEQFDDAVWTKAAGGTGVLPIVTANFGTSPDGLQTADRIQFDSGVAGRSEIAQAFGSTVLQPRHEFGVWMRSLSGSVVVTLFCLDNVQNVTVTADWKRFTFARTPTVASTLDVRISKRDVWGSTGSADLLVWGASLVPADQASLPYQRVNTTTDYDSDPSKFPLYLAANGTNTWMQTNSIDFTGTDKVTVFAGVRKLVDADGQIFETSATQVNNIGTIQLRAALSNAASYFFASRGSASAVVTSTPSTYPAPISNVISCVGNIAGDLSIIRVNGTQVGISTAAQGTGNYGNYPLYLFRRGGTSLPFNGSFYGLLIRGALTSDPDTLKMERWLSLKTGVQL